MINRFIEVEVYDMVYIYELLNFFELFNWFKIFSFHIIRDVIIRRLQIITIFCSSHLSIKLLPINWVSICKEYPKKCIFWLKNVAIYNKKIALLELSGVLSITCKRVGAILKWHISKKPFLLPNSTDFSTLISTYISVNHYWSTKM